MDFDLAQGRLAYGRRPLIIDKEFRKLAPKTVADLNALAGWLEVITDDLKSGSEAPEETVERTYRQMTLAKRATDQLGNHLSELLSLTRQLLAQRRSAQEAFEAGWNGRFYDILSKLSDAERDQLREALGRADWESEDESDSLRI